MTPRATTRVVRAQPRSLTLPTMAALGAVLSVVVGMFVFMLLPSRSLDKTSIQARHAIQSEQSAAELERIAVDLETGVRGYLLTHDVSFLQPYDAGRNSLAAHTQTLIAQSPPAQ